MKGAGAKRRLESPKRLPPPDIVKSRQGKKEVRVSHDSSEGDLLPLRGGNFRKKTPAGRAGVGGTRKTMGGSPFDGKKREATLGGSPEKARPES